MGLPVPAHGHRDQHRGGCHAADSLEPDRDVEAGRAARVQVIYFYVEVGT